MKNKFTLGVIVVIIALIVVFIVRFNSSKNNQNEVLPIALDQISQVTNGTYQAQAGSFIIWQGAKPLLANYVDGGTVSVQEGMVTVSDQKIESMITFDMTTIQALQTGSGNGQDRLSQHLQSVDFFDVAQYPQAMLVITSAQPKQNGESFEYTFSGTLTIKETTAPVTFDGFLFQDESSARVVGQTQIDRTVWDVRFGSGKFFQNLGDNLIADMIDISFDISFDPVR